jgi:sulfur-carrier protein
MVKIVLAPALARWTTPAGESSSAERILEVDGATVGAALEAVYARHPQLRGYVMDEHGAIRVHIALFVDAAPLRDKTALDLPLAADSTLYVMQALSGG